MGVLTSNPWENAWIILGLIVASFAGGAIVLGGAWVTWTDGIIGDTIARVILYIPIALGMFGFFADAVNGKYHYTPTSLTAIFGMGINKLLGSSVASVVGSVGSYVINRGRTPAPVAPVAPTPEIPIDVNPFAGGQRGGAIPCTLPGFEWLENTIAPQGLIVSMTVLFYILFEMVDTSQTSNIPAIGGVTLIVFLLQSFTYVRNGCLVGYDYGKWSLIIALAMSAVFAGVSYEIVKVINKALTSSASATPGTTPTAKPSEEIQVGQFAGEKSAPTDPNDQFVCEAYKDGELITSMIAS